MEENWKCKFVIGAELARLKMLDFVFGGKFIRRRGS